MRFTLIDRITDLQKGKSITAVKGLTQAEAYLADHFPRFPVMPGVLMLEAMFQASAWLVRESEEFEHSIVVLKEAKNIKYFDFVEPGETLTVTCEIIKQDEQLTTLKADGTVDGNRTVSGRLVLERYDLAERHAARANCDPYIRREMAKQFSLLHRPIEPTHP